MQGTPEKPIQTAPAAKPSSGAARRGDARGAWLGALERSDKAIVDRILADGFSGINKDGNAFTREGYLKEVANGAYVNWPIEPIDIAIRSFGDTAVLTSLTQIKNPAHDRRYTKVYVKQDGRWQCVASHESLLMGVDNTAGADGNSSGGMMMMGTPGQPGDQNAGGMAGMMATMMGSRGNPSNANPQGGMAGMMGGNPSNANPQGAAGAMMGGGGSSGMMRQMMRGGGMMRDGGG